jgi:hypothetical protein
MFTSWVSFVVSFAMLSLLPTCLSFLTIISHLRPFDPRLYSNSLPVLCQHRLHRPHQQMEDRPRRSQRKEGERYECQQGQGWLDINI